jgi:hypothetical protein
LYYEQQVYKGGGRNAHPPFRGRIRIRDFQAPGGIAVEYQLSGIIYHPGKIVISRMKNRRGSAKNDSGTGKSHNKDIKNIDTGEDHFETYLRHSTLRPLTFDDPAFADQARIETFISVVRG